MTLRWVRPLGPMRIDHHIHTSRHSPDSCIRPEVLLQRAREVGLDGVVITEHDYLWPDEEVAELARLTDDLLVLAGVEVSAREGHFLVYGLPDLNDVEPGVRLRDLLKVVRGHGAAIVAAHPYRWDQDFDGIVAEHGAAFDAIELVSNNVSPETRARSRALLDRHPMGATGSSDGHEPRAIGCYHTRFPRKIESKSEFVAALQARDYRPGHREGARLTSGPVG